MNDRRFRIVWKAFVWGGLLVLGLPVSFGATLWTGPNVTFTKSASTPSDTIFPGKVVLTRNNNQVLINTAAGETFAGASSPLDTMWAFGDLSNFSSLTYQTMESLRNGNLAARIVNQPMVVHLINEDIYFSIKITTWGQFGSGTVSYTRSTAAASGPPTPSVSITSPSNGSVFTAPADITIVADATVSSGTVTNVSFFDGSTLLGSVNTAPFQFTANSLGSGSYSLHAVATAAGVSSTSSVVNITVQAPISVSVSITNPANGAVFTAPANIDIVADATASGATVTNVSFFNGTSLLGSATSPPFSFNANNLAAGNYALSAVATASGVSSTSPVVNISVVTPVSVSVNITNPPNGAGFVAPATVVIAANATAAGATVTNVSFFSNDSPVGSVTGPPFTFTVNNLAAGNYALTAVATASGISSTSSVVNISVVAPVSVSVNITNPPNGAVFTAPAPVSIAADATAAGATVTNVSFFSNDSSVGSVTGPPFTFTVNNLAAGNYALTAVATASGISSTSSVVNISVVAPVSVSVNITNPPNGAIFTAPAQVSIAADATATSATVTNVSFFNGTTPLGAVSSAPFTLTVSNLAVGAYSLTAVATAGGVSSTSAVVNITVVAPASISLSVPVVTNGLFSFTFNADVGSTYIVQSSSNLLQWVPVETNSPSSSPVTFSTDIGSRPNLYFHVGRVTGP
jgi:uncharacterized protein (DUF2141 family)